MVQGQPPAPRNQVMGDRPDRLVRPRSSRQRYQAFVEDYKHRRLDDPADAARDGQPPDDPAKADADSAAPDPRSKRRGKRREYLREYLRWLWPHRYAVAAVFLL